VANAVAAALGARDAVGRQVAIAGSISCLPPAMGRAGYPKPTAELDAYRQLALRLAEGGVDLLLLEMLQAPAHAERACQAAKETGLPFWAGISCRLAPPPQGQPDAQAGLVTYDAPHNPIENLVATIAGFEPAAICVMHSPIDAIDIALACIAGASAAPIGAYAEIPYREDPVADRDPAAQVTPVRYADAALAWQAAGAKILGGCCGTTPAHIAAIAAHLRR
jgi:S-methylmethionine-dependent homocysteine/selenocysteine methylase